MSLECRIILGCAVYLILGFGATGFLIGMSEDDERTDDEFFMVSVCFWPLALAFVLAGSAGEAWRDRKKRQVKTSNDDVHDL